jgi:membrane protease YdiL (CAAX protease family)
MNDSGSKGISYSAGFFMAICFTIAGTFLASMLAVSIWPLLTGQGMSTFTEDMRNPAFSGSAKIVQSIMALVGFLLPAFTTAFMLNRYPMRLMGFTPAQSTAKQLGFSIGIMLLGLAVSGSLGYLSHQLPLPDSWTSYFTTLEKSYNDQVAGIIGLNSVGDYLFSLVVMAFLPALCEEALFRGVFQNFLSRATNKPWVAIIVVSLIFSVVHLSAFGFLSRLFLGIVLGAIYYYSGRLWLAVLAHFINNAIALSVLYYYKTSGKDLSLALNEAEGNYWGLLAIPAVIILFGLLQKAKPAEREKTDGFTF